ncbi:GUN4 domain-containing protein, partial [Lyngbya sp. CCY1209]|uniref:GUN4 domain-containing protein n=1 Tax=Lyngbya sp. CCY1209 TaxID=2886103 RepID=UPI002D202687
VFLEKERKRIAAAKRVWQQSQCQLQSAQKMVSQFQSQLDGIVERIDRLNKEQNQQQLQNLQLQLDEMNRKIENLTNQQSQQETKIIEAIKSEIKPILSEVREISIVSKSSGFDYNQLKIFLKSGNWKAADEETARAMLEVAGQTQRGYLDSDDIKNFPCEDLRIIDGLWVKYSNGRFGFSAQKQIYINSGGRLDGSYPGDTIWYWFADKVRWRVKGSWLSLSDGTFSMRAEKGHLPLEVCVIFMISTQVICIIDLLSRVETCNL